MLIDGGELGKRLSDTYCNGDCALPCGETESHSTMTSTGSYGFYNGHNNSWVEVASKYVPVMVGDTFFSQGQGPKSRWETWLKSENARDDELIQSYCSKLEIRCFEICTAAFQRAEELSDQSRKSYSLLQIQI